MNVWFQIALKHIHSWGTTKNVYLTNIGFLVKVPQKNQQSFLKQNLPTPNEKIPAFVPASLIVNKKQIIYFFLLQSLIYVFPSEREDQENNFCQIYFTFSSS